MKPRLFACVALSLLVLGAAALASKNALAQGGNQSKDQQSERDQGRFSEQIDKALRAYDERMGRNVENCRKEMDEMKKELHDLIDLRINMAISLAEARAKMQSPGESAQGGDEKHGQDVGMARELQQLHGQLRSEIDQQQNQITQLVSQLRGLQQQGHHSQRPGSGQRSQHPGQNQPGHSAPAQNRQGQNSSQTNSGGNR